MLHFASTLTLPLYQAPILENIDLGPPLHRYEINEFFNSPYTIYRGAPSPEVDDAWDSISEIGPVLITSEDVRRLGKDPAKTVRAPEHWGYGPDAHLAQVDGQHQLHCLNVLRKWAHYDTYFRPKHGDHPGPLHTNHRDHCLNLLLNFLTCHVSLDAITHFWMDTQTMPSPDFNMNKVCRNHERVLEWQNRNKISLEQWIEMGKRGPQKGDYVARVWPELVEIERERLKEGNTSRSHGGH
jgi:hypothetical protein